MKVKGYICLYDIRASWLIQLLIILIFCLSQTLTDGPIWQWHPVNPRTPEHNLVSSEKKLLTQQPVTGHCILTLERTRLIFFVFLETRGFLVTEQNRKLEFYKMLKHAPAA